MRVSALVLVCSALVVGGSALWTAVAAPLPSSRPIGSAVVVTLAAEGAADSSGSTLPRPGHGDPSRTGSGSDGSTTSTSRAGEPTSGEGRPAPASVDATATGSSLAPPWTSAPAVQPTSATFPTWAPTSAAATSPPAAPHTVAVSRVRTLSDDDRDDDKDDDRDDDRDDDKDDDKDDDGRSDASRHDD